MICLRSILLVWFISSCESGEHHKLYNIPLQLYFVGTQNIKETRTESYPWVGLALSIGFIKYLLWGP